MRFLRTRRSKVVTAVAVGAAFGITSVAVAYLTGGSSSGDVSGSTAQVQAVQITQVDPINDLQLNEVRSVKLRLTNPNSVPLDLTTRHLTVTGITSDQANCPFDANFVTTVNALPGKAGVAPNDSAVLDPAGTVKFNETDQNQDACAGVSIQLTYHLS